VKELVEYIARSLVDNPDQVSVDLNQRGSTIRIRLKVAQEDMGRIIGRRGRVANAIRTLLRVTAAREGQDVILDIVESR
jgi:predicted RNA-binding protein YlqC (UPF0109 family)